ncbi:hypothetical protein GSI_12368 [Ganoderma sinense ZZ0214-1]|uniref:Uncharacterized protein n=1 Tax=Ganoderma sinense ZZ0214-1 TaxID=1077348 RepID=A0A2G8RVM2_9APHY|nr:hypothetical protein GSI_12368 [Ganoderma sinense ZZ0214-1]
MIIDKATEYEHERAFAPPSEPPPGYDSAPYQPPYPAPQEPIPYLNQQPSTRYPAAQGPSYSRSAPQGSGSSYPAPQAPPYAYPPAAHPAASSSSSSTVLKWTPPPARTFARFETITVPTVPGRYRLADGFSPDLPPAHEQPHPFASHDVTQEDWLAFLGDIRRITQNTSEERLRETFGAEPSSFVSGRLGRGSSSGGRGGGGLARATGAAGLIGAIAEGVSKSMSGGSSKAAQEPISLLIAEWNRVCPCLPLLLALDPIILTAIFPAFPHTELLEPPQHRSRPETQRPPSNSNAYGSAYDQSSQGRRTERSPRRDDRRAQKRAERGAFATELIADVHGMFGAKDSSAAYRAAADEERYASQPGWCLVLRYTGPAPGPSYAGGGSGWATRA